MNKKIEKLRHETKEKLIEFSDDNKISTYTAWEILKEAQEILIKILKE